MKWPWTQADPTPLRDAPTGELPDLTAGLAKETAKRALLVWPVFAHVLPEAFDNFLKLTAVAAKGCSQYRFDPMVIERQALHGAMNQAVDVMLANDHSVLIAFDDDCLPALHRFDLGDPRRFQVLPRLLGLIEHGYDVVAGVGYMRGFPHTMTSARYYDHGKSFVLHEDPRYDHVAGFKWLESIDDHRDELNEHGLLEVDFCGVPIVAISRRVIDSLPKPIFRTQDAGGGAGTHDVHFCNLAKAHGYRIFVDSEIDCGHITKPPIVNGQTRAAMLKAHKEALQGVTDGRIH
jgi:hypothetical protein